MGLANILTLLRIAFSCLFIVFFIQHHFFLAALVFLLAALTDFYDGYFARLSKSVSRFGILMDPIADKVLILTALFSITAMFDIVWWWMVWVVLVRDILVTIPRVWGISRGRILAEVSNLGKIKTATQMTIIFTIFLLLIIHEKDELLAPYLTFLKPLADRLPYNWILNGLLLIIVIVTVYSGFKYLQKHWSTLRQFLRGKPTP
jgi:CDP-diacylglycerol--glycerol-3-phosphate 3-phosphatidyltransferase